MTRSAPTIHPAIRYLQRFIEGLCLLPVFLVPTVFTSFNTNTIVMKETVLQFCVLWIVLILPLVLYVDRLGKKQADLFRGHKYFYLLLTLFALYLYLSSAWVSGHPRSTHEFVRWLTYLLTTLVFSIYTTNDRRYRLYLVATVTTCALISLYAIGQAFEIDWFYKDWTPFSFGVEGIRRVCGSLGNPDYLAGYLIAVIPLTLLLIIPVRRRMRYLLSGVFLLELLALFFTYSRGAELALVINMLVAVGALVILGIQRPSLFQPFFSKRKIFFITVLLLALCGCLFFLMKDTLSVSIQRITQLGSDTSTVTRPYYWQGAFSMWRDQPLIGHGIGTFPLHYPKYRSSDLSKYQSFKEFYVEHAHNEFLEIAAETGVVGLFFYAAILLYVSYSLWRYFFRSSNDAFLLLGLWLGITSLLIHNLFTVTLRYTPSSFMLWSFAGVAIGRIAGRSSRQVQSSWLSFFLPCMVLLLAPYLFFHAIRNYVGDYHIRQGKLGIARLDMHRSQSYNRQLLQDSLVALYKSTLLVPDNIENYFLLGVAYHKAYDFPQAIGAFTQLESIQEDFTSTRLNLGISFMKQADLVGGTSYLPSSVQPYPTLVTDCLTEAEKWIKKGLQSDPTAPDYHHFLGRTYFHLGQLEPAHEEFLLALQYSKIRPFGFKSERDLLIDTLIYIGRVLLIQKDFNGAEDFFTQAKSALENKQERTPSPSFDTVVAREIDQYLSQIQQLKQPGK